MAIPPPVATEPAGQKQTKRRNSTQPPFYRSQLPRPDAGPGVRSARTALCRVSRMARTPDRAHL